MMELKNILTGVADRLSSLREELEGRTALSRYENMRQDIYKGIDNEADKDGQGDAGIY